VKLLAPGQRASADRRLLECDYGEWTGQELKTLAKEKLWRTVQAQPSGARFPGGESLSEMSARAVGAIRDRDQDVEVTSGEGAVWLAVSHGDVIKAILADALGMHLDAFQRIMVDPASLSVVRYTPHRAFVVTMNSSSGSLAHLKAPPRKGRRRKSSDDAVVGGGAGPSPVASSRLI
jgi:2,3-bisphosphoglycerate-dependent phosphoglycerate mutase